MILGASIGREGPSVQVGAAVMNAWGAWCKKHGLAFRGMQENDLIAAGAAGGWRRRLTRLWQAWSLPSKNWDAA